MTREITIVFLSDTHGFYPKIVVPDGDILVHSGDFGRKGTLRELAEFADWYHSLPHRNKIFVAGNHDWCFEESRVEAESLLRDTIYLQDSGVELHGLKFWGSPWQPRFHDWAFNVDRGEPSKRIWDQIPSDTSVLVTHGPPFGVLDVNVRGEHVGCEELRIRVASIKPRVHLFGHIHESHGFETIDGVRFVNGAVCDAGYRLVHSPSVIRIGVN